MTSELWRWQGGTTNTDNLFSGAAGESDTVVLTGRTDGNWEGTNAGDFDFLVVKLGADGDEIWRWQGGTSGDDAGGDAASMSDGSTVLVGSTTGDWGAANAGDGDFVAVKLDAAGTLLWTWQDGTPADERAVGIVESHGDAVLAGWTNGIWSETTGGGVDFCAVKLAADGSELWRWQGGTAAVDYTKSISVVDSGDSVVLAGYTEGVWSMTNAGGSDLAAMKLDAADGSLLWRWQGGTKEDDFVSRAVTASDGSIVLAGYSFGDWDGTTAGQEDFIAVKLDTDGTELWRWQEGTPDTDKISGAAVLADDSIILTGLSRGNWTQKNAGGSDFCAVRLHSNGTVLWRWQDGTDGDDWLAEAVAATTTTVLVAGTTEVTWPERSSISSGTSTSEDLVVIALDVGIVTPAALPTPASTPPPTALPPFPIQPVVDTPTPSFLSPAPSLVNVTTSSPTGLLSLTSSQEGLDSKNKGTEMVGIGIAAAAGVCLFSLVAWIGRALWCPKGGHALDTRPVQYKRRPPPDKGEMEIDNDSFVEVMDIPPVPSAPVGSLPPHRNDVGTP